MTQRKIGIILHGATGSLTRRQHLTGLLAIARQGGLRLMNGDSLIPEILLVGRSERRLAALAAETNLTRWTTDIDTALSSQTDTVFFDGSASGGRYEVLQKAIAAGKHIYTEKPLAGTLEQAMSLVRAVESAGLRNGIVQDKLFNPGFSRLQTVCRSGLLGRILEVRIEMGHWVFDGISQESQRSSWNYKKAGGGGIMLDMFPHWRYMIERTVGPIRAISAVLRTHLPKRRDEDGCDYEVDVEDAVLAHLEIEGGAIASISNSWCSRVRRDATIMIQIDGVSGSVVATPAECYIQPGVATPRLGRSSDGPHSESLFDHWQRIPPGEPVNAYQKGWELFLRHIADNQPFPFTFREGAKGVQLAELGYLSHQQRRWLEIPDLP